MNILELDKITKIVNDEKNLIEVLSHVTFSVGKGNFTTIIGPSGCGKSTLLRIIAGLIPQTNGQIKWLEDKKPNISFVFQGFGLFPYLTVFQNIEFGLKMKGMSETKRAGIVKNLIEEIGLTGSENKHPNELSGGMRQRVGIARALAIEPDLLLLDEPFSALDEFTAENLRKLLLQIWHDRKISILMVTHLIKEAIELADQIIVFTPKPGSVEKVLDCNLGRPRNLRSQEFFKLEDTLQELIKV